MVFSPPTRQALLTLCALVLGWAHGASQAASVVMSGKMGSKALLVVDGGQPKALAAGESHQGVKVIQVQDDRVVVEVQGERETITMGGVPTIIMGGSSGPFYATALMRAARGLSDQPTPRDWANAFAAAVADQLRAVV